MEALEEAKSMIHQADDYNVDMATYYAVKAQAYAAIAQAEQTKRIADILTIYLNDYDPKGNEAQGRTSEDIGY